MAESKSVIEHEAVRVRAWPFSYALTALYQARNAQQTKSRDYEAVMDKSGVLRAKFQSEMDEADKMARNFQDTIDCMLREFKRYTGEDMKLGDWQS
jgi:hypothetical protein